jgi:D-cysteine desulfhydrase
MKLTIKVLNKFKLEPYNASKWVKQNINEKFLPKKRINFNLNEILIEKLENLNLVFKHSSLKNISIFAQRDDLNHSNNLVSGNKIRKLEFLFADAIENNCKHVITAGGIQSNHCRAVVVLARMLNLNSHVFLRSNTSNLNELFNNGNLLIDRIYGANIYLIEKKSQYLNDIKHKMEILQEKLLNYTKHESYLIPIGGSNTIGLFGYFEAFDKILKNHEKFDDIVITAGSGGTMSSLAIANLLTGSKFKVHALNVCDNAKYFYDHLDAQLKELNLNQYKASDLVNIIDGYKGKGYGISTNEELELIVKLARETGILFDPVYTGKAFIGFIKTVINNFEQFKGSRILFIHTGGIFSHFDGRYDKIFNQSSPIINSPVYDCFYDNIKDINF